jgi:hypothetical protein
MEKVLADAFLDFYQKILKPEFDALKSKQAEHDQRFSEVLGHLDSMYNRLGLLEDGFLDVNARIKLMEDSLESGRTKSPALDMPVK